VKDPHETIIEPLLTEKSVGGTSHNKYTFRVRLDANKVEIRDAIEALFSGVRVAKVNTLRVRGKERRTSGVGRRRRGPGRTAHWKKAIVTLKEGKIPVFEGV
jgi:large subunit ribosomal protein L23